MASSSNSAVPGEGVGSQAGSFTMLFNPLMPNGLPIPQFIKVDVEGLELDVLRGARETLRLHYPVLFLEMHGETMNEKLRKSRRCTTFLPK